MNNKTTIRDDIGIKYDLVLPAVIVLVVFFSTQLFPGEFKGQALIFASLVVACFAGFIAICFMTPKWAVPLLIISVAPLRVFMTRFPIHFGSYTIVPLSAAIWILGIAWFIKSKQLQRTVPFGRPDKVVITLFILMVVGSIPALFASDQTSDANIVTWTILITGVLEPLILFMVIRDWIAVYNNLKIILSSILSSLAIGVFMGIFVMNIAGIDIAYDTVSQFRMQIMGFASANLAGHVLCLVYPLVLFYWDNNSNSKLLVWLLLIAFWVLSFVMLSRTTPVIMLMQTLLIVVWMGNNLYRRVIISSLVFIIISGIIFVPSKILSQWSDRMDEGFYYLQANFYGGTQLSNSDTYRVRERHLALDYLTQHPEGGRGATGQTDPENLYLDIATQLGWSASILFIFILIYLIRLSLTKVNRNTNENEEKFFIFFASFLGYGVYGMLCGSQLSKISVSEFPFWTNASPSVFFVAVLAIFTSYCVNTHPITLRIYSQ